MKKLFVLLTSGLLLAGSCNKSGNDGRTPGGGDASVSPNDPVAVSAVLIIPNSQPQSGNIPETTNDPASPKLTQYEESVSYSYGGTVKLPFHYEDLSGKGISGIYAQVTGADSYFEIPVSGTGGSGEMVLPIGLPKNLETGKFQVKVCVYVDDKVSNIFETDITVTEPMSCGVSRSSGGEGITSTIHDMGNQSGTVVIKYDTYTVPDRIDVFYGGKWVAGTGSYPGDLGIVPPLADCDNPTEGYVGDKGMFCFPFDPAESGSEVEVVVSGCVRGGTAWNYDISCAGEDGCKSETLAIDGERLHFDLTSSGFFIVTDPDLLQIGDYNTGVGVALYPLDGGTLKSGMTITGQQLTKDGSWELGISLDKADEDYGTDAYHENDQGSITITQYEIENNKQKISVMFNNVKCGSGSIENKTVVLTGSIIINN